MQLKFFLAASAASISLACSLATPVAAQQITTGIEGAVTDENGAPLSGAEVTITDTRTGATRTLTTGESGSFSATGLTTGGPYTVSANAAGYEGQSLPDVFTTLQGNTSLTFSLSGGSGQIVVSGARVRSAQLAVGPGQSFTEAVLENAPTFNRDVRDIIRLDPRVSLDRDDGGSGVDRISCLGGNDRGNAFTVDGISQGDIYGLNDTGFSSRSSTPLPYDAIRETQVQFAPFDVEYGQFTGCAINVVTKSGGNQITGGAFYEYSDSSLRADHYDDFGVRRTVAPIKADKHWGAYLGVPLIQDRVFLFGAYEHQDAGQSQDDGPGGAGYPNELTGVPVAAFNQISQILKDVYGVDTGPLVTSRDYTNDRYFIRGDVQITDDHRFEATYQKLDEKTVKADDFFTGSTSPQVTGLNTFYNSGTASNYYSGRLYSQWTDAFSTELRYSKSKVRDLQDPVGGGEAQDAKPIIRFIVGVDNPTGSDGAVLGGPGNSRSANDLRTNVEQYRAVAKLDAGSHKLKLGAELNRAKIFNLFVQNATGTLVFRNAADLAAGLLSPGCVFVGGVCSTTGSPNSNNNTTTTPVNVIPGYTEGAFINRTASGNINDAAANFNRDTFSVYAQDDWRVNDSLSVVLGVRTDWYDGNRPAPNAPFEARYGFSNTTGFSNIEPVILPRLGFTYDVNDFAVFSRTQLHGGVGIFSGGDPLVWFGNAFQNDGSTFGTANLQAAGCPTQSPTNQVDVVVNGQFTGIPQCVLTAASNTAAAGLGNTQSIDPDVKMPTVLRANIGFQSELNFAQSGLFSGWRINADYIYSHYRNPFTVVDLAQAPDVRKGLAGYAIDGRPVYSAIDTRAPGCTAQLTQRNPPVFTGLTAACFSGAGTRGAELMLTNSGGFRSHNASILLSKNVDRGIFTEGGSSYFSFGYAYTDSQDRRNMYNSTATSNYGQTAAFDRQNPAVSPGFYQSRHNITVGANFAETLVSDLRTSLGFTFIARSGRPYSLTYTGNNVFNTTNGSLSTNDNALIYLPTGLTDPNIAPIGTGTGFSNAAAVQKLVDFASSLDCAKEYLGRTIPRNTCNNDWYYDMDVSFSQELPGPGRFFGREDKLKLFATVDNFLNLLDSGWNIQRRRNFFGVQDIGSTAGVDAQGRYIITSSTTLDPATSGANAGRNSFQSDNGVNVSSSIWRLKVGISYDF